MQTAVLSSLSNSNGRLSWLSLTLLLYLHPRPSASAHSSVDSAGWERSLVSAWSQQPECSASDMCSSCGFGAVVVDLTDSTSTTTVRTYTTGPADRPSPWHADSTFELASLTKPLTALSMLIHEGEGSVSRDTTLGALLPCEWSLATTDVASITLLELVQHGSGLPSQPPDHGPGFGSNPFADYTSDRLCTTLLQLEDLPTRGRYLYSNYGYGALGYALTLAVNASHPPSYEEMLANQILNPLQMINTSVTFSNEGWAAATHGCARSDHSRSTMRKGSYGVLQGNGALRSTLNDMTQFLLAALYVDAGRPTPVNPALYGRLPPPSDALTKVYDAMALQHSLEQTELSCTCVSEYCEGSLCDLPNPNREFISLGGLEGYTSATVPGWRKSGDTSGYSLRAAWSAAKGRAALTVDTCGGCGGRGTAGSASQRAALLLADGPPPPMLVVANRTTYDNDAAVIGEHSLSFAGDALSQDIRSVALVDAELYTLGDNEYYLAVSSSDGTGATVPVTLMERNGKSLRYAWSEPVHFGTGPGAANDPFYALPQMRTLVVVDGDRAYMQDMGADTILNLKQTLVVELDTFPSKVMRFGDFVHSSFAASTLQAQFLKSPYL